MVVAFDKFNRLNEDRLPSRRKFVHDSLYSSLEMCLDRNDRPVVSFGWGIRLKRGLKVWIREVLVHNTEILCLSLLDGGPKRTSPR